ncbi:MAG: FkbM family methyltransferase [archaeon]
MAHLAIRLKNFLWRQALKYLVNPNKVVNVQGNKMFLDSKDSLLLSIRRNYEPRHVDLLKRTIKSGDYVLDVGAHIGYYTLLLAKLVGKNGKVFSFEPDPENFKVLQKNVKENGYKNVILENKAVSNKNGRVKLFLSKINKGDTRIYPTFNDKERESESRYEVDSVRLDTYLKKNLKKIKFFKMDIQGAELFAFNGMKNTLKNKGLKFTVEFSPENLTSIGSNPQDFLDTLLKNKFSLFDVDKQKKINPPQIKSFVNYYKKINYFTTIYGCK